jgi:hypothetical protein
MAYDIKGTLLEACNCNVLCPCWIGEDPDNGTCDALLAYDIEEGSIDGVDVGGRTWFSIAHIPGNILAGGFRSLVFVDEAATPEQLRALTDAFQGRLGGPLADLAQLTSEWVGVVQAPIEYALDGAAGSVRVDGGRIAAQVAPYRSAYGETTTLRDSVFSTIPGSPAWVGKAEFLEATLPEHGYEWRFEDSNAIQGEFHFQH